MIRANFRRLGQATILSAAVICAGESYCQPPEQRKTYRISSMLPGDPGMAVCERILRRAYEKLALDIEVIGMPAARALLWSNSGRSDGELCRMKGVEKRFPGLVRVPVAIHYFDVVAFGWNPEVHIQRWGDLAPYRLGLIIGMMNEENRTRGMTVEPVPSIQQALLKLSMHRTDFVVVNRVTGRFWAQKLGIREKLTVSVPLERVQLFHYLNQETLFLRTPLTRILGEMERSGEIGRIRTAVWKEYDL